MAGRPGSWEADAVRSMLLSAVGEDPAELLRHRTEPLTVVVNVDDILTDLGYSDLYYDATNRGRHLPTVAATIANFAATCLLSRPSAHASTILDRNARDCADFARRDQRNNCSRSSSVNVNSAFGRPVVATHQFYYLQHELVVHDTSRYRPAASWQGGGPAHGSRGESRDTGGDDPRTDLGWRKSDCPRWARRHFELMAHRPRSAKLIIHSKVLSMSAFHWKASATSRAAKP